MTIGGIVMIDPRVNHTTRAVWRPDGHGACSPSVAVPPVGRLVELAGRFGTPRPRTPREQKGPGPSARSARPEETWRRGSWEEVESLLAREYPELFARRNALREKVLAGVELRMNASDAVAREILAGFDAAEGGPWMLMAASHGDPVTQDAHGRGSA